jgi:ribosomal protein S18 acetylase RimI-like enzyme
VRCALPSMMRATIAPCSCDGRRTEIDFFTGAPHAHISEIAVVRDGLGAGRALISAAEDWASARGSRYVSLHVTAKNARARTLYERLGYELEHSRLTKVLEK